MLSPIPIAEPSPNSDAVCQSTSELRVPVARAVKAQRARLGKRNAFLSPQEIDEFCAVSGSARDFLEDEISRKSFSQRAVSGVKKLSRTIADMAGSEEILAEHIAEAVSFRGNVGALSLFSGE